MRRGLLILSDRALNLVDDGVDLAVRIGSPAVKHLVAVRLGQIRNVVCATPAYLAEHGTPRRPDQLTSHQCITFGSIAGADSWTFKNGENVGVRSRLTVNTAEAAIDAALTGLGLTRVLSYQIAAALEAGTLVTVLKRHEPPPSAVNLVYRPELRLTAKVRAFIDFATPEIRKRLLAER